MFLPKVRDLTNYKTFRMQLESRGGGIGKTIFIKKRKLYRKREHTQVTRTADCIQAILSSSETVNVRPHIKRRYCRKHPASTAFEICELESRNFTSCWPSPHDNVTMKTTDCSSIHLHVWLPGQTWQNALNTSTLQWLGSSFASHVTWSVTWCYIFWPIFATFREQGVGRKSRSNKLTFCSCVFWSQICKGDYGSCFKQRSQGNRVKITARN